MSKQAASKQAASKQAALKPAAPALRETDLYPPVKAFLERQGYVVKGEVRDCDVVAIRGQEPPVIVELKTAFGLPLLMQGVARQTLTDAVYLAFPAGRGAAWSAKRRDALSLCRRLGLGVLIVETLSAGADGISAALDPGPYRPRKSARRTSLLLKEFERRRGDPTPGGGSRRPVMTAYRQDALACARRIAAEGPARPAELRAALGVEAAGRILQRDVYGWFLRVERGVYDLSEKGRQAVSAHVETLTP